MKTRSGTLLVVGLLVCSVVAAQGLYAEEPGSPEWGTDSVSYYNIHAFEFVPISSDTTYFFDSWMRYITGGYPALVAGVHLPSGTVVENVSFAVCDEAAGSDIQLRFWECPLVPITAACTPTIIATTAGLNGCDYVGAPGGVPFAIDNATKTYFIEFNSLSGDSTQRLDHVRLNTRLQVSPAPAVATFNDVPVGAFAFQHIEALAASGITAGCGGGNFCPDSPLTRAQMAVFLAKALGLHWAP